MFGKSILGLAIGTLITCCYGSSLKDDFFEKPVSHTVLMESGAKPFGQAAFNVLEALSNPQFMTQFGQSLEPSVAIRLSTLLNQASSNFLTYALQQIVPPLPVFVIYKFTVAPQKDLSLPEFASLYEDLLDKDELITPTIEEFYYDIKDHDISILPFERFVTLCATGLKNISEGRRAATHDFLRRALDNLKEFNKNISLELMGAGAWEDEVVLKFQEFINGRAKSIEQLLQQ